MKKKQQDVSSKRQRISTDKIQIVKKEEQEQEELIWCEGDGCYKQIPEEQVMCDSCKRKKTFMLGGGAPKKILLKL